MNQTMLFTGGGSAGHVTPNLALIEACQAEGWRCVYMGSAEGIEKELLAQTEVPYYAVASGKLRRYLSWQNLLSPFKLLLGLFQAWRLLGKLNIQVVFSKGGYVAVPVVLAAKLRKLPVVVHESDLSPGLANRLCFPWVDKICLNFDNATLKAHYPDKVVKTGTPIRESLFQGDKNKGLALCGFNAHKPTLLVMGGSLGAGTINQVIRAALPRLINLQVIHLCGKGKLDGRLNKQEGYCQFEYANEDLAHLFAASDIVLSRAGANALFEILALNKPHLLIPLSKKVSRGDQVQNAAYFEQQGVSLVVEDEQLTAEELVIALTELLAKKEDYIQKIKALEVGSATAKLMQVLKEQANECV